MKSIYTIVLVAMAGLAVGCVRPMQYSQPVSEPGYQSTQQPVIQGGLVPVDIQNPVQLEQEILLFCGLLSELKLFQILVMEGGCSVGRHLSY